MSKMKGKRRRLAAAVTAAVIASLSAGMMTGYGASYYNYDWNSGVDYGGYTVPYAVKDGEEIEIGPGVVPNVNSVIESGPSVSQSAVVEQYHADYKIYEESIEGIFFFYSNVANGGITHEPVVLDLPANLMWTVEKDGEAWTYESKQPITEYGTYVFRLSGVEDSDLPLSEQKEYWAVFRFRIQEKPPEETVGAEESIGELPMEPSGGYGYDSALVYGGQVSGGVYLGPNGLQTETEAEPQGPGDVNAIVGAESETAETEAAPAAAEPEESALMEESETEPGSEAGDAGEGPESAGNPEKSADKSAFTQTYDAAVGKYRITFEDGVILLSTVPGGYIGAGPVQLLLPESGWEAVSLYKDDELLPETAAGGDTLSFSENGYYRVEAGGNSWSFALLTATNRMDIYPAPVGMTFKEASLDGQPISLTSKDYVLMEEDGQYALTMEGAEGDTLMVGIKKDTEAPVMEVALGKGAASIQYLSDDITVLRLEKSGELVENFNGYSVTTPGSYRLTIADEAGNTASTTFTLKYQINGYGVAAVVLIILVIAGVVIFVIHTKRNVKIR